MALLDPLIALCESEASDVRVAAILSDLKNADIYKGQLGKAFESQETFIEWGRHYAAAALSGFRQEWPINFKDESSKIFGGKLTRTLITKGDEIFNELEPPVASCSRSQQTYSYSPSGIPSPPLTSPTTLRNMSSIHSSAGPCFLGASRVKMAGGSEKRCDEIQPGDIDIAGYRIRCVIKTLVSHALIVRLEGPMRPAGHAPLAESGGFTLWHPVMWKGKWQHPADVGLVEREDADTIYNFVLEYDSPKRNLEALILQELKGTGYMPAPLSERPGVLIINGLMTPTLGHDMEGPVIGHPYFGAREVGKRNVMDDLQADPGWHSGRITWKNVTVIHDATTGFICGMKTE
jgi:hypothetical protein